MESLYTETVYDHSLERSTRESNLEKSEMSETKNFFENPNGGNSGWGAGIGGLIGAAVGSGNGLFGGNRETATLDQVDSRFNSLQNQMSADALQHQIGGSTAASVAATIGVKDAVVAAASQNALALCGLGHTVQAGFADTNKTILLQGAASRELAIQQALDAERARATELRIALSEQKNQAGHTATQVLLSQVVNNQGNP